MEATHGWTVKAIVVIIFTSILFRCVSARNHTVGGISGWNFNPDLQLWADSITFHEGDNLVFKYGQVHNVLEVNRRDYTTCRTSNPIITHTDGISVVPLTKKGTRYFICGRRGHCSMGLRLRVHVVAREAHRGRGRRRPRPSRRRPRPSRRRPRPIPRFDSPSPPATSNEHILPPTSPPAEGPPPQLPRSASSSAAGDGGFMIMMLTGGSMIMMLMITGALVYSFRRPSVHRWFLL